MSQDDWDMWVDVWQSHSRLESVRKKIDRTLAVCRFEIDGIGGYDSTRCQTIIKERKFIASLSGGKDSVAMVALMVESGGLGRFQCAHATSGLSLPESEQVCMDLCDKYDLPLDIEEPATDVWNDLASIPSTESVYDSQHYQKLLRDYSSGNVMVQYQYKNDVQMYFLGIRAEESKGRKTTARVHGPLHRSAIDQIYRVCPILWLSARDIWSIIVSRNLPIHPFYRRCCVELDIDPETNRMDSILPQDGIASLGQMAAIKTLYPDLWARLLLTRPELAQFE